MPLTLRNPALDVLRALAVVLVLGRNLQLPGQGEPAWLRSIMSMWHRGGWVGVDIFFVISGFLVAGLLLSEHKQTGTVAVGRFLVRRAFKIYPAFYFMLAVSVAVLFLRGEKVFAFNVFSELAFLQSYLPHIWNHTWSLAVEEHFYLALAFVTLTLVGSAPKFESKPMPAVLLLYSALACACLWMRLQNAGSQPYSHEASLFPTHLRIDSLFFGVLLSYMHHVHGIPLRAFVSRYRLPLAMFSGALLSLPFALQLETTSFVYTYGLTLNAWGAGGLLLLMYYSNLPSTLPVRGIAYLGAKSYSVYLWHMPVLLWLSPLLGKLTGSNDYSLNMVVRLIACVVVGIAAARLIEFPAMRFRDRIFPSHATANRESAGRVAPAASAC
jgi:peptidoglycan/LPS O-acetylase OafA/YrhL